MINASNYAYLTKHFIMKRDATIEELEVLHARYNELSKFARQCIKDLFTSPGASCQITVTMPDIPQRSIELSGGPEGFPLAFFVVLGEGFDAELKDVSNELFLKKISRVIEPGSIYGR